MSLPKLAECTDCMAYGPVKWYVAAPSMVALCAKCQASLKTWAKAHHLRPLKRLEVGR